MSQLPEPRPLCSVVIAAYNEEENLLPFYNQLREAAEREACDWEFIFVDDGSRDGTFALLKQLHTEDPRVKVIRLARNFGAHEATTAGLRLASGDLAIHLAADLQDPPVLFHEFLKRWREGFLVVSAVRSSRDDELSRRWTSRAFYWLIRRVALKTCPPEGTGSFCLIDRKVLDVYNAFPERNRILFGLLLWSGFPQTTIPYDRVKRVKGVSNWSFRRRVKAAIDTIVAFSAFPIRLISAIGVLLTMLGLGVGCVLVLGGLLGAFETPGWGLVISTSIFLSGLQFIALGGLGEYLWRVLDEVRGRPLVTVLERLGSFTGKSAAQASVAPDRREEVP